MKNVGLRCQASTFDPCLFFVFRDQGLAVDVFTTDIGDILRCGAPDALPKIREFPEQRFGTIKLLENSFVHVGMELEQADNFSVTLTHADFTKNLQHLGTSPELWAARQKLLSPEDAKLRQCKLGELCLLATVSRPDICATLARIASRINSLRGAGVYRINDSVKTIKKWQPATVLKYFSSCTQGRGSMAPRIKDERHRKETIHGNAKTLVGWSDAAYGDQSSMSKCRLGNVIGFMSSNFCGPRHLIQWTSEFTRKLAKICLGGGVYASSEMLDHMSMLREFYGRCTDWYPGMVGLEDCESLFTHL